MQDMTSGSISRHILNYAVPIILGNIMQLTYNAADSVIIGKKLGENALAAVSASSPIMTVMILGASGIGIGASVIMSRFYGAKDMEMLKKEFSTTIIFSAIFSIVVFAVGMALSDSLLNWIHTPEASYDMALTYLRIIFVGFLFTFQYNILSFAMRSIGDSKTPVWFLGISCGLNILLDVLFIMVLSLGVAGAAAATALSEAISVILCIWWIRKKVAIFHLKKEDWVVDGTLLRETIKSGGLNAVQQSAQPIGKVLIQSVINLEGVVAIGAFNAVSRIDDFARIPTQSIGSGIMTCTAQNRGAKQEERMFASLWKGLKIALCYFPIICAITLLLKGPAVRLLSPQDSQDMVEMGVAYLAVKAWFFVMPCLTNAVQGFFRGMGKMTIVLIATIIQISIRTVCVFAWVPQVGIVGEAYGCFLGWACMLMFEGICYTVLRKEWKILN